MKILLVEDDEVFHAVIGRALSKQGHETVIVSNGEEGVEKAREETFDPIITDILMPSKDGIDTIREIRAARWFITASANRDEPQFSLKNRRLGPRMDTDSHR